MKIAILEVSGSFQANHRHSRGGGNPGKQALEILDARLRANGNRNSPTPRLLRNFFKNAQQFSRSLLLILNHFIGHTILNMTLQDQVPGSI